MFAGLYLYRLLGLPGEAVLFYDVAVGVASLPVVALLFLAALFTAPLGGLSVIRSYAFAAVALVAGFLALIALAIRGGNAVASCLRSAAMRIRWYPQLTHVLQQWPSYGQMLAVHGAKFVVLVDAKSLAYFALDVLTIQTCFLALHISPSIALVATAYMLSLVFGYLAMTPAGLGAADATLTLVFLKAGLNPGAVVGVILLYRLVNVLLPAPFGAWSFYSLKRKAASATYQR